MAQNPLPPPPPSGGVLDGWLYLLWRRLTQAGQILWESITPGTSADVAAVVTDETGSPGSLVFSGNPTLQGATVDGVLYVGDTTATGSTILGGLVSTNTNAGTVFGMRKSADGTAPANFNFFKSRGTNASPSTVTTGDNVGLISCLSYDGTAYTQSCEIRVVSEGTISTGIVPAYLNITTRNASGSLLEAFRINSSQVVTIGGTSSTPALKVTPVASQARWIEVTGATSSTNPTIGVSGGNLAIAGTAEVSGNLVFTGTGNRITGDFSNATSANRTLFQTTTTNTQTAIGVIPNGSGTQGTLIAYNNADPDNAAYVVFLCNATESSFRTSYAGTAGFLPMTFHIGGAERSRIATSGAFTCGGASTAPALKVTPVASQARWIEVTGATSSTNPTIGVSGGNLATSAVFMPVQATTAGAPAYVLGGMYYDTTLNKLRIGGATAWETVTSV